MSKEFNLEAVKKLTEDSSLKRIREAAGIGELGSPTISMKAIRSMKNGVMTYIMYLAPAFSSKVVNTCPCHANCYANCLNKSGQSKINVWRAEDGHADNYIQESRIKRTLLWYYNTPVFVKLLRSELDSVRRRAEKAGLEFAVRLNGTSDIHPFDFHTSEGHNILDLYPDIQFYDYTKVIYRIISDKGLKRYSNYDLTFSYDGSNWADCEKALKAGVRVAVVFDTDKMPERFMGYRVVNGSTHDIRFKDPHDSIVYLEYHKTADDYRKVDGKRVYFPPQSSFIIRDPNIKIS